MSFFAMLFHYDKNNDTAHTNLDDVDDEANDDAIAHIKTIETKKIGV